MKIGDKAKLDRILFGVKATSCLGAFWTPAS
jgi:hypothetical protein